MNVVQDTVVHMVIPSGDLQFLVGHIERCEVLKNDGTNAEVAVYWGVPEMQRLVRIYGDAPNPMLKEYNWPGMYQPFAHQKVTASFLSLRDRCFCFNEAGTGKTSSVIWAADYLMQLGMIKRVLVVCPLSIMYSAWQADIFKTAMHRTVGIAYGDASKRKKIINGEYEFVVINFDGVGIVQEEIGKAGFDLIVVDECFVAGTLVATPLGRRPIEQLEAGDKVLTSDGVMRIKRLVCNTAKHLVEVKLGNGKTIRCTSDHPFFTDAGWVCAKNLKGRRLISGAELSCLRAGISPYAIQNTMGLGKQHTNWVDLLKVLRAEEVALTEPQQKLLLRNAARAAGQTEWAENTGTSCKTVGGGESSGAQTEGTWGQRYGNGPDGATDFRGLTCGLGMELPRSVGEEAARLSYELQTRLCVPAPEDRTGGGWGQSHICGTPSAGSEEGAETGGAWVVGVSHIECPDGEVVYNLEIEGTPNYFVGDYWLAHNCNAYKTVSTKRWKILAKLITPSTRLWMMTGTPASQSPLDAFGLAKLVNPAGVPKYFTAWRDRVMQPISKFKWIPRAIAQREVFGALQPAIRFEKADCLDLPELVYQTREVPLTAQVNRYYRELKSQLLIEAAGEQISAVNAAAKLSKLLQLSGGAIYTDNKEVVEFDVSPRLNALMEVLDETQHKVVVFVPFRHTIVLVARHLSSQGVANEIINGDVPARERAEIINRFQTQTDPRVLVIQPQAASHGVTLTAADTVVFWSPVMSVETYLQCIARIDRVGQKNSMTVVHLQGSEAERKVYQMLQGKVDTHEKLVDLYKEELGI